MKQKGVALLLALFTLIIISLLVVAFFELTTIDLQIVSNHFRRNQALYIAEAGVEYAVSRLRNSNSSFPWTTIYFTPGSGNTYNVTYASIPANITSIGTLTSDQRVNLEAKVSVRGTSPPYNVTIISWREH